MPTLISRGCSPELATRVRAYARQHPERSTSDSIAALLAYALDRLNTNPLDSPKRSEYNDAHGETESRRGTWPTRRPSPGAEMDES